MTPNEAAAGQWNPWQGTGETHEPPTQPLQQQIDELRARVLELERAAEDERSYQREQLEYR